MRLIKSVSKDTLNDHIVIKEPLTNAYVSVVPTKTSIYNLLNWLRAATKGGCGSIFDSLSPVGQELYTFGHVTIMYSPDHAPKHPDPVGITRYHQFEPLIGTVIGFEEWPGWDNTGYIVAILDAPGLHDLHKKWKDLGCVPTFKDYTPHITLIHPYAPGLLAIDILNQRLQEFPLGMEFVNETIVPLTKD